MGALQMGLLQEEGRRGVAGGGVVGADLCFSGVGHPPRSPLSVQTGAVAPERQNWANMETQRWRPTHTYARRTAAMPLSRVVVVERTERFYREIGGG
jgi:hypothetical protein